MMQFYHYQPFSSDWATFFVVLVLIGGLIGLSEFARNRFHWSPESTRKLVHVAVGIAVSISPLYFRNSTAPMVLAGIFIILNLVALRQSVFTGLHGTGRISYGTVFFPLSYLILVYFEWSRPLSLMVGLLMMTFADTAGSIIGQRIPAPHRYQLWRDTKSLEGSMAVFITAFVITLLASVLFATSALLTLGSKFIFSLLMAATVMLGEGISNRGSDNLSVPLLAALMTDLFIVNQVLHHLDVWLIWWIASALLLGLSIRLGSLSVSGGVVAFLMGIIVFGSGGWQWTAPFVLFFILSSLLSRIGQHKNHFTQKGSQRDFTQVLANGGLATVISIIHFYYPSWSWNYPVFLGAIAAATADTWATEIGFFSSHKPRHILTGRELERGMSGGVTMLGFTGAFLGATVIASLGWYYDLSWQLCMVIVVAGFLGSLLDSILGGTLQSMYRCEKTGTLTEKRTLDGYPTIHVRGWKWMDNDMVNLLNTFSGALMTLYLLI